jgi:DNA recombination protein RmuC
LDFGGRISYTGPVAVAALIASVLSLAGVLILLVLQWRRRDPIVALADQVARVREETGAALERRFGDLRAELGQIKGAGERIVELSRGVGELKSILDSPTLKGRFGEFSLEQMLRQALPAAAFEMQAGVGAGARVDAVVKLPEGKLAIDSKLPLETARRLFEATGEERASLEKQFAREVRGHADAIARKYLVQGETLDLALMYVGIEKVYSQIVADPELQEHCWGRRVIPVSPNTLWATLSCFAMAFARVAIEQEARGIVTVLGEFLKEIDGLERELDKLRDHLRNAQNLLDDKVRPKLARVRRALEKPAVERVPEKVP